MKKYLVDVYLPTVGKHLNAYVPSTKEVGEVINLLAKAAESLTDGSYKASPEAMLMNAVSGAPYELSITIEEAGIRNASQLILI